MRLSTQSIKKCYDSGHGKEVWFIHWSHFIWLKKKIRFACLEFRQAWR
jgi:hypothetical protein